MLKVYAWNVCPHCKKTVDWLQTHKIPFQYLEIEEQPEEVVRQVVDPEPEADFEAAGILPQNVHEAFHEVFRAILVRHHVGVGIDVERPLEPFVDAGQPDGPVTDVPVEPDYVVRAGFVPGQQRRVGRQIV